MVVSVLGLFVMQKAFPKRKFVNGLPRRPF